MKKSMLTISALLLSSNLFAATSDRVSCNLHSTPLEGGDYSSASVELEVMPSSETGKNEAYGLVELDDLKLLTYIAYNEEIKKYTVALASDPVPTEDGGQDFKRLVAYGVFAWDNTDFIVAGVAQNDRQYLLSCHSH